MVDLKRYDSLEDYSLKLYLNSIKKIPLLTAQEEKYYIRKATNGDKQAREILINSNLRLVVRTAKRYRNYGLSFMDLIEEGNTGLITAIDRYDEKKSDKFIGYASWWIKQAIKRALSKSRIMPPSYHITNYLFFVENTYYRLAAELGHFPTKEELSKRTHIPIESLDKILRSSKEVFSLDKSLDSEGDSLITIIPDSQQKNVLDNIINDCFREKVLAYLSKGEKKVIRAYFGFDSGFSMTANEIGTIFGISPQGIIQTKNNALKKIRRRTSKKNLLKYLPDNE